MKTTADVRSETLFHAIPGLQNYWATGPDSLVLNAADAIDFDVWAAKIFMEGKPPGPIQIMGGLRIYRADWLDRGHALVLWHEKDRLSRAELVNLCL